MQYNLGMINKQPNSRMCFICGLENPVGLHLHIYETEPGVVETTYVAPEHFQGYPGVLHGGIVGAIIDEISGRALMGSDPMKSRSAEAWAGIYEAETGELLAEGTTLLMNVPSDQIDPSSLDELGWKVYPE